ncbi:hypothetical protein ACFL27_17300 [candidate division CSSED10-310 bacterium]|uniref:Uncharacterized protein n=1 Tax=candidate division CSSED10-310 bacterium TaxID=2855610 RepID=A0ABV6Z0H9_UNCC1
MDKGKFRALLSVVPLTIIIFTFGMFQALGVEQSYATMRNLIHYFGLDNISLLSKGDSQEGAYIINGRKYYTRIGDLPGNEQDIFNEYNRNIESDAKFVHQTEKGGHIFQSDGNLTKLIAVEKNVKTRQTNCMEQVAEEIITERQQAIEDDPIVNDIIADLKAAKIKPQRIAAAVNEYARTQTTSDLVMKGYLDDLLARVGEIKSEIDVPGKDLEDIARFPGSVRVLDASKRSGSIHLLGFESNQSVSTNAHHYRSEFISQGWTSIQGFEQASSNKNELVLLLFTKKDRISLVSVKESSNNKARAMILTVVGFESGAS